MYDDHDFQTATTADLATARRGVVDCDREPVVEFRDGLPYLLVPIVPCSCEDMDPGEVVYAGHCVGVVV
jgi:hypothetical protein